MKVSVSTLDPKAWFLKAKSDLKASKVLLKDVDTLDAAAYHAQQLVEKKLKGFLVFHNHEIKKTHDLEFLVDACAVIDFSFVQLRSYASNLNQYSINSRYPDDYFTIDFQEAKQAYKQAKCIYDFAVKRLPKQLVS